ncbi:hypothetical protein M5K25_018751 [Dendrobium thyrsiflorum]|uniref:SWIM-type domain-containing protein n=1 Tax=Dendrobium thyrsiflorum TaxID=117978 RepID=A0ABD0UDE3_DENTH
MTEAGIRTVDAFSYLRDEAGGVENIGFSKRDAYNFIQKDRRAKIENGDTNSLIELFKERQNVLLGVAFLSEETIESFTWLFKTFVRIMGDKHPTTIFTDQDQAMARAIEIALPHIRHRLCQWHISKKAPSKVACFNSNPTVRGLFYKCLSKCDSEVEFEESWSEMINQGDLQNHDWLKDLYRIRNKWSTAFNKNCFNLGILSTQHSESTNNICHGISKATSSITECFLGLEKLMITWRRNEQDEDFRCSQSDVVPVIRSSPILKQAARYYSRKLYSFFEEEFLQGVGGMSIVHASADSTTFFVKNADRCDQPQQWTVHFDAAENLVQCTCGKFSMMGILCSHTMRVFRQLDISKIPSQYLLLRWSARGRKDFYAGPTVNGMGNKPIQSNDGGSGIIFKNHLSRFAYQISTRAQGNEDAEQYMLAAMVEMADNVDFILAGKQNKQADNLNTAGSVHNKVKDPVKCRPKGVSNARLKSHWEKKKPKRRRGSNPKNTSKEDSGPAQQFVHSTCSTIPECLTEEYILRRPSSLPSAEYTRMLIEIIDSDRQS